MANEYQLTFNDYISILRRRGLLMVATLVGLFAVVLVVVIAIPPVYQSTGTIMVESQQIPTELIQKMASSYVEERIEIIKQRVMTRENLLKIIEKYGLFKDSAKSLTVSEKVDEIRKHISIEPISANAKSKREQVTIAFKLIFEHRHSDIAHKVANELVTLFLEENVKVRTQRATETTEFLTQEGDKLKVDLEKIEGQLAAYKQEHSNALPQHQQLRMEMLSRTEAELKELMRDYKTAQEELRFLDLELSAAKAGITPKTGAAYTPQAPQDLGSLKAEYERLLSLYKEAHPDVRAVKRKIEAMESAGTTSDGKISEKANAGVSLDVAKVQAKIASTQARLESFDAQIKTLRGRLVGYEQQILKSPQVERGLITLMRDHENAQKKYEEIRAKLLNAKITESLEGENKAERFSLLEAPAFPDKPAKPDRAKLLLIGIFVAIGGAGGVVLLLETLNHRIRGQEALAIAIRQRPMLVIPYIVIKDEVLDRKQLLKKVAIGVVAVIAVSGIALHVFYMPLDILIVKIFSRFG
jgi:succinoglycan biosynthesis transport protein ExoP